jgi:hypothetical protein
MTDILPRFAQGVTCGTHATVLKLRGKIFFSAIRTNLSLVCKNGPLAGRAREPYFAKIRSKDHHHQFGCFFLKLYPFMVWQYWNMKSFLWNNIHTTYTSEVSREPEIENTTTVLHRYYFFFFVLKKFLESETISHETSSITTRQQLERNEDIFNIVAVTTVNATSIGS